MKTLAKILMGVTILGAALLLSPESEAGEIGSMRVGLVQGDVQVKIAETGEWVPASVNMPLVEGDELWVPEDSRAEIQTNNGASVRFDAGTALQVLRTDIDSFQFNLSQGRAYVLNNASRRSVLQFDTPDTSIRVFGISTFRIDIPQGETDVSVFKGSVQAENDAGTTTVQAGNMLALWGQNAELSKLPPPDDWQAWNKKRDRAVLARGRSYGYLPVELRAYSSDFDGNGRWVNVQDYGYVWTPTVVVNSDWAPYRNGRWVWRGGDYIWVGYEPWGWTPYHYGRWAHAPSVGWFWVPPARGEVYWGPGYVGWVRTGEHVAWVPLAPRETYYGHGNYGRYSQNITNVNINQVRVTNVYRNVNVTNSITVVNQSTFVTGRPSAVNRNVVVNVKEDFVQHRNIVVGRPSIKPEKTSYSPVVRSIPEAKHPPAAVRKIDVKELKQSRSLVKEPDRSAIQPQAKPRPLEVRKVEKPRSVIERAKERPQVAPAEKAKPQVVLPERGKPQVVPPEKAKPQVAPPERGKPREAPPERAKPQAAPPERGKPRAAPPERAKPQVAPPERGKPREVPPEKAKPQVAPPERAKPQAAPPERVKPQVAPPERAKPQAAPPERGKSREAPPERAKPQVAPPERGKPREVLPERAKPQVAPPERGKPREVPIDNVQRETPRRSEEQDGEKRKR